MSKVDNRIVEMGFENKGFEKGIKDSQASLKDFDKALHTMAGGTSFAPLEGVVSGLANKFSLMGTIAIGALLKIGNQAVVAGQQLLNSLGPAQVAAGFSEYELKINSIKTILAGGRTKEGLPVTLEMVNQQLEELNKYSDQTIYSFSDMTRNIGKFTNAGVDLETSVQSIKGIANAAALSGANSEEAARAMYNFAQGLSAGHIKLIDWKSIENANMATVDFKTELMESAVAAGTLEKTADGMYKVLTDGGMDEPISATKMFNQSLEKQWMTSEVLTATLTRYSDATTEIGKKATEAATKVRTFKQLMDTTKEALGSGWAMTFEHIFGNFEEATKLWTAVSDELGGIIQKNSDARNELLKTWKAIGGRRAILKGLSTAWENIVKIVEAINKAFRRIFPPTTAYQLLLISKGFQALMTKLTPSEETLATITKVFEGLFSALELGWKTGRAIFEGLVDGIKKIIDAIPPGKNGGIVGFFTSISDFFINLNKSAKDGDTYVKIFQAISEGLGSIVSEGSIFMKISTALTDALSWVTKKIKSLSAAFAMKNMAKGPKKDSFITVLLAELSKLVAFVKAKLAPVVDFIKEIFKEIKDAISINWEIDGIEGILKIVNKLITGGFGIALINLVKNISGVFAGLTSVFNTPLGVKNSFLGLLDGFRNVLTSYQKQLEADRLKSIAIAIGILVASLAVLTLLDQKKMLAGIGAITALFANIVVSMVLLDKLGGQGLGGGIKGSAQLLVIANAVLIIAGALMLLKDVEAASIWAMTVVLAELVVAMKILGAMKAKDVIQGSNALTNLSIAINLVALAVLMLGQMDPKQLKTGLSGVSMLMGEMLLISIALASIGTKGKSMLAAGAAMGIIALALLQLTGVVAILAQFNPEKLLVGIGGLAAILGVVAIGMMTIANPKVLFGAVAMMVMAGAISLFVPALLILGSLPIKTIAVGIAAIAAIFTVLGIAGLVLAPLIVPIIAIAGAVALLGVAMLAAGTGVMLFGAGLALIATAGVGAITVLILAMTATIALVPLLLKKVGEGLIALAVVIGEGAPEIMEALGKLITEFLALILEQVPAIYEVGLKLILGLLEGLRDNTKQIVEAAIEIVINFLNGVAEKLPDLIEAGANLIIAFLDGIATQNVRVIDAAFGIIIDFLNGLADSIRENTPLLLEAVKNLCTAFIDGVKDYLNVKEGETIAGNVIKGLINGITNGIKDAVQAAKDVGSAVLDAINGIFRNASPSKETEKTGEYVDLGLIKGLRNRSRDVVNAAKELGQDSLEALRSTMNRIADAVNSELDSSPVITPVLDLNNIRSGANSISQLLSARQSYDLATSKIRDDKLVVQANQNGSNSLSNGNQIINNEFNLSGITIRSEADIDKLAEELYRRQENTMRSRGMRPAYSN